MKDAGQPGWRLLPISDSYSPAIDYSVDLSFAELMLLWSICNYGQVDVQFTVVGLDGTVYPQRGSLAHYIMLHYRPEVFVSDICGERLRELHQYKTNPASPDPELLEHPAKYVFFMTDVFVFDKTYSFEIESGGYYGKLCMLYHGLILANHNLLMLREERLNTSEPDAQEGLDLEISIAVQNRKNAILAMINHQQSKRLN